MFATCLSVGYPVLTGVRRPSAPENQKVVVCAPSRDIVGTGSAFCGWYSASGQKFKANGSAMSN